MDGKFVRDFISRFGGVVPSARDIQEEQRFPDSFTALKAALEYFNPLSALANLSFSGVVYKLDSGKDKYAFSGSVICTGAETIQYTPVKIRHCATAFWRTSGHRDPSSQSFSEAETGLANKFLIPFYSCDHTGILKVYQPGDNSLSSESKHKPVTESPSAAAGTVVQDGHGRIVKIGTHLQQQHFTQCEELSETPVSMEISRYASTVGQLHL